MTLQFLIVSACGFSFGTAAFAIYQVCILGRALNGIVIMLSLSAMAASIGNLILLPR